MNAKRRPLARRRLAAAAAVLCLVLAGLAVHLLLPDSAFSDIAGDALYAGAVYAGLVLVAARWHPLVVGAVALAWCVGVELLQLTGMPERIGGVFPPVMLVLGTVFDARDLVVYAVAVAAATILDLALGRRRVAVGAGQ